MSPCPPLPEVYLRIFCMVILTRTFSKNELSYWRRNRLIWGFGLIYISNEILKLLCHLDRNIFEKWEERISFLVIDLQCYWITITVLAREFRLYMDSDILMDPSKYQSPYTAWIIGLLQCILVNINWWIYQLIKYRPGIYNIIFIRFCKILCVICCIIICLTVSDVNWAANCYKIFAWLPWVVFDVLNWFYRVLVKHHQVFQ